MSIKIKLISFLGIVSLILGGAIWLELSSAYRIEKKLQLFVPATGYLLGIAEVNTGITRQAKEALDYLVTGMADDREQFNRLTNEVERGFELWLSSAEAQRALGVLGESEDIREGNKIRASYSLWVNSVLESFDLIDLGKRSLALMQYERDCWTLLEQQIFTAIDLEMLDGFSEVEDAHHELLLAMGGRLWGLDNTAEVFDSTQAAIDNVIGGCQVNSAVGRQFSALSTYLLTGNRKSLERYEELKVEVRSAINGWFFAAYEQSLIADSKLSTSVSHVSKVISSLEELLDIEEQAIILKQAGVPQQALQMIIDGPMESPIGDHLPLMVFSALGSGSEELLALAAKSSRQGVVLFGFALLSIMAITFHLGKNLLDSLKVLQDGMDAVSLGDLQQEITLKGRDELARLAQHFNRMSNSLHQSKLEVELMNVSLEQRVAERTKELAKANQELEAFNSAVSHDLRSPLSMVIGYSEYLLEQQQDADELVRSPLKEILSAGEKMEGMIGTLLDLSRIDSLELNRDKFDLSVLAKEIIERLKRHDPKRQTRIILERHMQVEADFDLLTIVLENLLGNAWKYSAGQQRTEIELGCDYDESQRYFFIRDNGAGFDMAEVDKLFKPFQRLHVQDEFDGTGIGLATVQRIVQCHGGEIWAEGEVGVGATFYFSLG